MSALSTATREVIQRLFSANAHAHVAAALINECGNNLPMLENEDEIGLERVRLAVLKLSGGDIDALQRWIDQTKVDWRDTLMAAGFANSVRAHKDWYTQYGAHSE